MTVGATAPTLLAVPEGQDVILIDRPLLPTKVAMVYADLVVTTNYTVQAYDLSSPTPTVDLFSSAETGDSATADSSNITGAPVMAAAVIAPTGLFGGIWTQDATGYTFLFRVLQSDLSAAMEGGHSYRIDVKLITTLFGDIRSSWIVACFANISA